MKSLMWKATGILAFALLALGSTATAHASHLNVRVVEPTPATVGQPSELAAALTSADTGQPVAGVNVTFFAHASFGKVSGYMEIGHAVTDSEGIATIPFVPRESGAHDIRVDYALAGGGTAEEAVASVAVEGSADQMYVQKAGIQVPGLNSWLIIGLLSVVWGILLLVAVTVIRIAHAGEMTPAPRPALATAMAPSRSLDGGSAGSRR
ncbi:MAG: hypothetical protein HY874_08170 [Chloroflexi bacterium]|nr:hypothetical protein [Chloroflexota bacterium]